MDDPVSSKSYESGVQMLQQAADKINESLDDIYKYIFGHFYDPDDRDCRHQEARPGSRGRFIAGVLSARQ